MKHYETKLAARQVNRPSAPMPSGGGHKLVLWDLLLQRPAADGSTPVAPSRATPAAQGRGPAPLQLPSQVMGSGARGGAFDGV